MLACVSKRRRRATACIPFRRTIRRNGYGQTHFPTLKLHRGFDVRRHGIRDEGGAHPCCGCVDQLFYMESTHRRYSPTARVAARRPRHRMLARAAAGWSDEYVNTGNHGTTSPQHFAALRPILGTPSPRAGRRRPNVSHPDTACVRRRTSPFQG